MTKSRTETPDEPFAGLNRIEKRSIDFVPERDRHGRVWQQVPFWFLGNFQVLTLSIGFIGPALGLSFGWCALAGVLGILVGTVVMAFHASQGPHLGLPQLIQSRAQFGFLGVMPILLAAMVTFVGVNIVMILVLREGLAAMFGWNKVAISVSTSAIATVVAVLGHDWLHKTFRVLLYASLPLYLVLTIGSFFGHGREPTSTAPAPDFTLAGFLAFFSICTAWNIGYALYVSDYSRYLPSSTRTSSVIAAVFGGASASAIWLVVLGSWIATRAAVNDPLTALRSSGDGIVSGLGAVLVLGAVITLAAVMSLNTYSCTLTLLTGQDSVRSETPQMRARIITTIVLSVATLAVSLALPSSALTALNNVTLVIFYLLVPWSAINLIDFFVVRRGQYSVVDLFKIDGLYGRWSWRGLTAYTTALLVAAPFLTFSFYTAPLAKQLGGVDISFVVSLVVAGGIYLLATRSLDLESERGVILGRADELSALTTEA
jgi:nucleobase:cation symporter-1, NCS1 family